MKHMQFVDLCISILVYATPHGSVSLCKCMFGQTCASRSSWACPEAHFVALLFLCWCIFFSISVELTLKQGGGEKAKKESSPYLLQPWTQHAALSCKKKVVKRWFHLKSQIKHCFTNEIFISGLMISFNNLLYALVWETKSKFIRQHVMFKWSMKKLLNHAHCPSHRDTDKALCFSIQ